MVGRQGREEQLAKRISMLVDALAWRLNLPTHVRKEAEMMAKELLDEARKQRLRIKVEDAVASRVYQACKISSFPMILSHYLATLKNAGFIEQAEFFQKKLSKANKVLPCRAKPLDLKSFVSRLAVRLAQSFRDFQYVNAVEAHARLIADRAVKGASDEIRGKNPILVAAACLCAADDLFGNRIGTERICKVTGVGDGVRRLSAALKRIAPLPLKGEWTVWREGTRVGALRRLARHKVMRHVMREKEVRA